MQRRNFLKNIGALAAIATVAPQIAFSKSKQSIASAPKVIFVPLPVFTFFVKDPKTGNIEWQIAKSVRTYKATLEDLIRHNPNSTIFLYENPNNPTPFGYIRAYIHDNGLYGIPIIDKNGYLI